MGILSEFKHGLLKERFSFHPEVEIFSFSPTTILEKIQWKPNLKHASV